MEGGGRGGISGRKLNIKLNSFSSREEVEYLKRSVETISELTSAPELWLGVPEPSLHSQVSTRSRIPDHRSL